MRVSDYIISLSIDEQNKEYLLIHGYSGAIDVVSNDIHDILSLSKQNPEELLKLSEENLSILKSRGYVTDKDNSEEKNVFKRVAEVLHQHLSKNYAITLIPTYNCNFRCSYCFEVNLIKKGRDWLKQTMSHELVDHIFDFVDSSISNGKKVKEVILFGGEPLLKENHSLLQYITTKTKKRDLKLSAITNGYDLDCFSDLLDSNLISSLQITVDGLEEIHDKRRVHYGNIGTFNKIIDNVDMFLKKGINIVLRSNIDTSNIEQTNKLIEFYSSKGWTKYNHFSYYFKSVHSCYVKESEKKLNDVDVIEQINTNNHADKYKFSALHTLIDNCFTNFLKSKSFAVLKAGFCGGTAGMHVIDPFGDLYACWEVAGDMEHCMGKITQKGNITYNQNFDYWRNRTVQNIDECLNCAYALFCGGGCPAHAKAFGNSIYDSYCNNFKEVFNKVVPETYKKFVSESSAQM